MVNTSGKWKQAAHTIYQLSSPSFSTRTIPKQKNCLTLNEKIFESFLETKKSGECTSRKITRQKEQEELGRKRRDIGKGNQKTVLRFQTGGKWPSYIPGLPSGPPNASLEETQQQTDCLSRSFTHTSTHTCTHTHKKSEQTPPPSSFPLSHSHIQYLSEDILVCGLLSVLEDL